MKYITLLFFVFCASQTICQTTYNNALESDKEAIALLESISNKYSNSDNHRINFTLDIELSGQSKDIQEGTLIQQGDKFVLDIDQRKIISDGDIVWLYLKEQNEVQINDADFDESEEFMSPSDIFELHNSEHFVFAISNQSAEDGENITQIEGKPLDDESEYSKIRLTVIDKGNKVKRLKIFGKDGSRFTMHLNKISSDLELNESTFKFIVEDYEGVFVEDLRF